MKIANLGGIMEKLNLTFLMESLTRTSVQAGVLVMVVLAVQWLLRKQLSPRWRCAMWLLVVTRLLLPVSISSTASIFNLMPFWTDRAHNAFEPMTRSSAANPGPAFAQHGQSAAPSEQFMLQQPHAPLS